MTFGEKLSKLRKEYNYTQEELADILGVSRQSISKWESDIAYPEIDKLIKMGKLFASSMDYLLNDAIAEKQGIAPMVEESIWEKLKKQLHERKSSKMIFGMPLYHIGREAHGFFAVGLKSRGVFSLGLMSKGIVSMGLLSLGVLSFGLLSLGLLAFGVCSLGLLAVGSIALGLFAAGAIAVGVVAFGALSVGCFSAGALAVGKYIAVGEHAHALIAIGESVARGSVYSHVGTTATADVPWIVAWLDANVPAVLAWGKGIFKIFLQ